MPLSKAFLLLVLLLMATAAVAQPLTPAPPWTLAVGQGLPGATGTSATRAVATDAHGFVFVAGYFTGTITLGSFTLTSKGEADFFLAKYLPSINAWAWAVRGGGLGDDLAEGLAISGSTIYLTGAVTNNLANNSQVTLDWVNGTVVQAGAVAGPASSDLVLARYTDTGTGPTLDWTTIGGGLGSDFGSAVAVGSSTVYVTGTLHNDRANSQAVLLGGRGTTPGTRVQYGAAPAPATDDVVLLKYQDQGATAALVWSQVAGGTGPDMGQGLALSGTSIYVAGTLTNDQANSRGVLLGGTGALAGTSPQYGATTASSSDLLLAKYVDTGPAATLAWTQIAGGTGFDLGDAVAVSGTSVYLTGLLVNSSTNASGVLLGGAGAVPGTVAVRGASPTASPDLLLAKYVDNGPTATYTWSQVAGGTGSDFGSDVAATADRVYVIGSTSNSTTNASQVVFGGNGTTPGTVPLPGLSPTPTADVVVAAYRDAGPTATLAWVQKGGGPGSDEGYALTLGAGSPTTLYAVGLAEAPATFGSQQVPAPAGRPVGLLAALDLAATLATAPAPAGATFRLFPNPARGAAHLAGAPAGSAGEVVDALGRRVAIFRVDAGGTAAVPAPPAPGLYLVRAGAATARWVVE